MAIDFVGAGILNIITESLYDNPIVVFREYVQNSVDSILKEECQEQYEVRIWHSEDNLFFLDNGRGIDSSSFYDEMRKIGASNKRKQKNLGYKGIGRLSGVPYCKKLFFVNILDYEKQQIQMFSIDGVKYENIKNNGQDTSLSFSALLDEIGSYSEHASFEQEGFIAVAIERYSEILKITNSGFLVVLQNISPVLENTIKSEHFFTDLQWLLPVDFDNDLYESDKKELFNELTTATHSGVPSIKCCKISYNDKQILRPIKQSMFRDYVCKSNFKYAIGFHTFKGDKIYIDKNNIFSGIKIYIDNMLLCDETELLNSLDNYGLLSHTLNGQVQSVRGIGAMIYITDKVNISANARRTFIEVTDADSLEFLKLLAEFVNTIYDTRYALSNYASAKAKQEGTMQKMQNLKVDAISNLRKLAKEDIELSYDDDESEFNKMNDSEKKRVIKKRISNQIRCKIKEYLTSIDVLSLDNAYSFFIDWLQKNK